MAALDATDAIAADLLAATGIRTPVSGSLSTQMSSFRRCRLRIAIYIRFLGMSEKIPSPAFFSDTRADYFLAKGQIAHLNVDAAKEG